VTFVQPPQPLSEWGSGIAPTGGASTEIAPQVFRVTATNPSMMTGPGTNSYVIGSDRLIVIDPGPDDATHRRRLLEVIDGRPVEMVVVTHTHIDHAPGANPLARELGAPCGGFGEDDGFIPDVLLGEGDIVGQGDHQFEVLHTPGHASNHLCYLLSREQMLFTGDHIMEGSTVVLRPPDASLMDYLINLERLKHLSPPLRSLAPGHGRVITNPVGIIDDIEHHRAQRHDLVRSCLESAQQGSPEELVALAYPEIDAQRRTVATMSLWAHLRYLVQQGEASVEPGEQTMKSVFTLQSR